MYDISSVMIKEKRMKGVFFMLLPSLFQDAFDDMFNTPFSNPRAFSTMMQTDIRDLGDEYQIDIDLPGYEKEDISAQLRDGYLTIIGNHVDKIDESQKTGVYLQKERYEGSCKRSFYVGEAIHQDEIFAKFNNGVLSITIPKKDISTQIEDIKKIEIK